MTRRREADRTPTLNEAIRLVLQQVLANIHTVMPAEVVEYDETNQTATVQPSLQRGYDDPTGEVTVVNLPQIVNVPVAFPRAGSSWIHFPIAPGDAVMLVVAERSLDNWKAQGGISDPAGRRKFNLTDAVALPGGYSPANPFSPGDSTGLEIRNGDNVIKISPTGQVSITAQGELLLGAESLSEFAAIASSVENRLAALESGLQQLITDYTAHTHPTAAVGPPSPPTPPPTPFSADTSVVASSKVKIST